MFDKFIKALILVEDSRFKKHFGIDLISICRAFFFNLSQGRFAQGGSTITQQLARTLYLNNKKTIARKIREILIAFYLEFKYSKEDILFLYLKNVYMGQYKSGKRISGFIEASQFYFGKSLRKLSIAECAALIAMVRGPNLYKIRSVNGVIYRMTILRKMLNNGIITEQEFLHAYKKEF